MTTIDLINFEISSSYSMLFNDGNYNTINVHSHKRFFTFKNKNIEFTLHRNEIYKMKNGMCLDWLTKIIKVD